MYNGRYTEGERVGVNTIPNTNTPNSNINFFYNRTIPPIFSVKRFNINRRTIPQKMNIIQERQQNVVLPVFRSRGSHQNTQIVLPRLIREET